MLLFVQRFCTMNMRENSNASVAPPYMFKAVPMPAQGTIALKYA